MIRTTLRGYIPTLKTVLQVRAEFVLKKHSGGFERERDSLFIESRLGEEISYRALPAETRAQVRELIKFWSRDKIETLNAFEDFYREKAKREGA